MKTMSTERETLSCIERQHSTTSDDGSVPRQKRCLPTTPTGIGTTSRALQPGREDIGRVVAFHANKFDTSKWSLIRQSLSTPSHNNRLRQSTTNNRDSDNGSDITITPRITEKRNIHELAESRSPGQVSSHFGDFRWVAEGDVMSSRETFGKRHQQRPRASDVVDVDSVGLQTAMASITLCNSVDLRGERSTQTRIHNSNNNNCVALKGKGQRSSDGGQAAHSSSSAEQSRLGPGSVCFQLNEMTNCLYGLLYFYELHRVTLAPAKINGYHNENGASLIKVGVHTTLGDVLSADAKSNEVSDFSGLLGPLPTRVTEVSSKLKVGEFRRFVSNEANTFSVVTSVSDQLVSIGKSRNLFVGDVVIEINGHYVVGRSVEHCQRLLESFINQTLNLVVASTRNTPDNQNGQSQNSDCSTLDASSSRTTEPEVMQSRDPHLSNDAQFGLTSAAPRVQRTQSHKNTSHVTTGRSTPYALRRVLSDVTAAGSVIDVANNGKRRSISFDNRSKGDHHQQIDIPSQKKLAELNSYRNALNLTAVTDSSGFHHNADESRAGNERSGTCRMMAHGDPIETENKRSQVVGQKNKLVYFDSLTIGVDTGETNHPRSTHQRTGRVVGRSQNSPHPKWLTAAIENRVVKRTEVNQCQMGGVGGGHNDFVSLSVRDDDAKSTSSDDSMTQETLYYDEYGWQCVTAV